MTKQTSSHTQRLFMEKGFFISAIAVFIWRRPTKFNGIQRYPMVFMPKIKLKRNDRRLKKLWVAGFGLQ
ncbi:hypothetical protein DN068_14280 [Taibaiella soli]|uniref:Uncharacterized protein n=1 Tax=Taibaiella soli TaxID=1649169 RepID=A0A2W2AIM9_9BACT|nr:hypothetical protein DN068_14280 [Taibaiella soli]